MGIAGLMVLKIMALQIMNLKVNILYGLLDIYSYKMSDGEVLILKLILFIKAINICKPLKFIYTFT